MVGFLHGRFQEVGQGRHLGRVLLVLDGFLGLCSRLADVLGGARHVLLDVVDQLALTGNTPGSGLMNLLGYTRSEPNTGVTNGHIELINVGPQLFGATSG